MSSATEIRSVVGKVLRQLRVDRGLTQEGLGHAAGLHRTYVGSTERGERNVSIEALNRWLHAVNTSWDEFGAHVDRALP